MVTVEPGHESRCWKAREMLNISWHVEQPADGAAPPRCRPVGAKDILIARDVEKTFTRKSGLRAIRFDAGGGFPIRYSPEYFAAVDRVSLTVGAGETVGLVGESGCGKSTLARCLIRLIDPSGGVIELDGHDVTAAGSGVSHAIARSAQIVFQNPDSSLNPRKTVRQILSRPLRLYGDQRGAELDKEMVRLLEMVRLAPRYLDRYPHEMSGGEKQRIGIARALATKPKFLICDEAVSALDVSVQASILNLLAELRDALGLAYLFITHDLSVVRHIADRIAVMYRGGIVEIGAAAQLLNGPHHPYTEALLSSAPTLDSDDNSPRVHLAGAVNTSGKHIRGCRFADRCPRKIGAICDDEAPSWKETEDGVRLACHHSLEELRRPIEIAARHGPGAMPQLSTELT
jgi:peptide/nickel transport system ATP-binding protein